MCACRSSANYWCQWPTSVATTSSAPPGAELAASKILPLKKCLVGDVRFSSMFPTWTALRSVLLVDREDFSQINFAGFSGCLASLPCTPAASGGCWQLGGAHRPSDGPTGPGMRCPRKQPPPPLSSRCCKMFSLWSCSIDFHAKIYITLAERGCVRDQSIFS